LITKGRHQLATFLVRALERLGLVGVRAVARCSDLRRSVDAPSFCFRLSRSADIRSTTLLAAAAGAAARICAFDLLELNGVDLRGLPLIERKKHPFKVIRRSVGIEFVEHVTGEGPRIFEKACSLGYEGIVSKRIDRPYRSGQTKI
jgi:hypothetical protein